MAKPIKLYKSYAGSAQDYEFIKEYLESHGGLPKDFSDLTKAAVLKRNESEHRRGQDYVLVPGKYFYLVRKGTLDVRAQRLRQALAAETASPDVAAKNAAQALPIVQADAIALHHGDTERVAIEDVTCGLTVALAYHEGRFDGKDLDVKVYNRGKTLLDSFEAGCAINPLCLGYKDYAIEDIVSYVNEFGHIDFGNNMLDLSICDDRLAATLMPTYGEKLQGIKTEGMRESYNIVLEANTNGAVALRELLASCRAEREELGRELMRKDKDGYCVYPRGSHDRGKLVAKIFVMAERLKLARRTLDQLRDELMPPSAKKVKTSPLLDSVALASLTASDASGMVFVDTLEELKNIWGYSKDDLVSLKEEVAYYGLDAVVDICLDPAEEDKDYVLATWDIAGTEIRDLQDGVGEYSWAVDEPWTPHPNIEQKRAQAEALCNSRSEKTAAMQPSHAD